VDPTRSAEVPKSHLGEDAEGILNADRYSAYKTLEKVQVAFCWSHVRRDFLRARDGYRRLYRWGSEWVRRIDELFGLNAKRLEVRGLAGAFAAQQRALKQAIAALARARDAELRTPDLHPAQRKALESLRGHWKGLTIFVVHPEIRVLAVSVRSPDENPGVRASAEQLDGGSYPPGRGGRPVPSQRRASRGRLGVKSCGQLGGERAMLWR
jgi:hypothetical protein